MLYVIYSIVANALSILPGEYARKGETWEELTGARTSGGACGLIRCNAEEPYQGLDILQILLRERSAFGNVDTGGAWLSSARVVRCWVAPQRAQPLFLVTNSLGSLERLPGDANRRKVRMTSSQHAPYVLGHIIVLQWLRQRAASLQESQLIS